jgi:molybdopterin molybdotransferase
MAARDPSCEDDFDEAAVTCATALDRILAAVAPVAGCERLALRAALDRILAAPVVAPADVPQAANSAMDGFALRGSELPPTGERRFPIAGVAYAGRPYAGTPPAGTVVRVMTGAVLPAGTDTVVIQEHALQDGDAVVIGAGHRPGQHVRAAGEDLRQGEEALPVGHRVTPADLGLIASLGIGEITVHRRVRVACFSTGDELRSIGEPLEPGTIYDSNRYTLHGMLARAGVDILDLGVVRDHPEDLERALREAAGMADAVLSSGGVSIGAADHIKDVLARIGEVRLWKVALKPGRPLAFGRIGAAHFFGLPGNPVSVMVTFYQFVRPALLRMAGTAPRPLLTVPARTTATLRKRPGRAEFQRGRLSTDAAGALLVTPTGAQGSGMLHSMSQADCFIVLPLESGDVPAGSMVGVQPFHGFV